MEGLNPDQIMEFPQILIDAYIKILTLLLQAKVLVIGAGGLGCPVLQYLGAAGVGTIGIIDHDVVEISNLQRQILFKQEDVGKPKAFVAQAALKAQNPDIAVIAYQEVLNPENAQATIQNFDLVIDDKAKRIEEL